MSGRDPAAFAEFAAARSTALGRTAYLMVTDHALAQDLLQEALAKTFVAWPRLRDTANAEAYTRRIMVTTAISWRRRRSFHERPHAIEDRHLAAAPDAAEGIAVRALVWEAIKALPPRQRAALVLRYYEDLTEAQTAEILGCAVGTVKSLTSQALGNLRKQIGREAVYDFALVEMEAPS